LLKINSKPPKREIPLQEWRPNVTGGTLLGRRRLRRHAPFYPVNDNEQQYEDKDHKEISENPD